MEEPNIKYILKLSGNDESVRLKLINVLKYELPLEIEAYYATINQNQLQQAVFHVHKIKHKMAILGLENSYSSAEIYENQLSENRVELQSKFENTLTLMLNFVNSL
ncbi:Hpt domain-containing protein [Flavobacterium myungsuense]|uniref:Hpt domain-containing protein n=1 Tax=Flavobacterium myungsuense TaxID=651823 RepID=A0ABW3IZ68_9FLAO